MCPSGKYPGEKLDTTLSFSFGLDRSYKWWVGSFSNGDFKELAKPQSKGKADERPTEEAMPRVQEEDVFPCPQEGCVRLFQRLSNLERHLSFEKCSKSLERLSLMDLSKTEYASLLYEGAVAMPALLPTSTFTAVTPVPQEGWALKETKKSLPFQ